MQEKTTSELERELSGCATLSEYLTENTCVTEDPDVSEALMKLIEVKKLHRADIIAHSGINDIYVHQILSGKRRPSRDKLLCLVFGMGLTTEETQTLLKRCGYGQLYAKNRRDSVVLFALQRGMNLLQVNEQLFEAGEDLLS